jgi:hypothetical protein
MNNTDLFLEDKEEGKIISSKSIGSLTNTSKYYSNNMTLMSTAKSKLII